MNVIKTLRMTRQILVLMILLAGSTALHAAVTCDADFVEFDQGSQVIRVAPTGADDTSNVQCSADLAIERNVPTIALEKATYRVSDMVVFDRFKGSLQGGSTEDTIIEVLNNSIDCLVIWNGGQLPAVFKFIAGEPRVRFMTISVDQPCNNGWALDTVVHFTGFPGAPNDCSKPVIFATAERMAIKGLNVLAGNGPLVGISAHAEGLLVDGACSQDLLGSLYINRNEISDTEFGVVASMRSSALVNVNFNTFSNNFNAVLFIDSAQNATLSRNVFNGLSDGSEYFGFLGLTDSADAPTNTGAAIVNSRFDVTSSGGVDAYAITFINLGRNTSWRAIVLDNRFNLSGNAAWGLAAVDVSDGLVAANAFSGSAAGGILVGADSFGVTGWSVTANTGFDSLASDSGADVWFGTMTSNCVFGPGQNADVVDQGINNAILASSGASGLDALSPSLERSAFKGAQSQLNSRRMAQAEALVSRLYRKR
jgi:hypothetical protein